MINQTMLKQLSKYRVLYAEDDEGVRKNVSEMLSMLFKDVFVASDGEQAYQLFKKHHPELVITDIQMPKLSGIELAKKIRQERLETQIIIISAYTQVDYMLEAVELSLVRYMVKPITETKLFEALKRFLEIQKSNSIIELTKEWIYDSDNKVIKHNTIDYELTKKESYLLELLLSRKSILTYREIEIELWQGEHMSLNALRLLMKNFRKKLPKSYLKNIQGVGYKL